MCFFFHLAFVTHSWLRVFDEILLVFFINYIFKNVKGVDNGPFGSSRVTLPQTSHQYQMNPICHSGWPDYVFLWGICRWVCLAKRNTILEEILLCTPLRYNIEWCALNNMTWSQKNWAYFVYIWNIFQTIILKVFKVHSLLYWFIHT